MVKGFLVWAILDVKEWESLLASLLYVQPALVLIQLHVCQYRLMLEQITRRVDLISCDFKTPRSQETKCTPYTIFPVEFT
jgi:hypothetical protein